MSKRKKSRPRKQCRCGKQQHYSLADARGQRLFLGEQGRTMQPITYYKCTYGYWHWTSSVYNEDGQMIATLQDVLDHHVAKRKGQDRHTA
ncbi:hypothetical protein [Enteractinococcus helveticum]|uniref:Uncharacterized protein n=1 Tax=Enteractinococcus helveticum TaxID=1837282 RepID=A0A1B7M2L0_9MICC|nr:hypothetical protein [Enteractinococcus helveticum]OAV62811.1 hypothetical protein A6F49_04710 [Enteractinococcus helveticum]